MKRISLLIMFIGLALQAICQEKALENSSDFLEKIAVLSNETRTISADFTQEKTLSYLKEKQYSSGKFYSKDGNMRWEQKKPSTYIMLLSEDGVKIKEDENEKEYGAMAIKFMDQIRSILLSSIHGDFAQNKDFTPSYFENKTHYIVKLKPVNRRLSKMFESVHLSFDKTTYRLKILSFIQKDGISNMMFSNEEFNNDLESSLFKQF